MTYAQRLLSLSLLGALSFAFAPLTSAQTPDTDPSIRENIRVAVRECRSHDDREEVRSCLRNLRERFQNHFANRKNNKRRGWFAKNNISDEVRAELKTCRDSDDRKACAMAVAEKHGIEVPPHRTKRHNLRRKLRNAPQEVRDQIATCREHDTREEKRACMKKILATQAE